MELLIVITIIAILAGLVVSGLIGATNQARAARTRAQIMKIDTLIMERYEGYRTRAVPFRIPAGTPAMPERFTDSNGSGGWESGESFTDANGNGLYDHGAARTRLYLLRELMRMELPDRITDVTSGPVMLSTNPSLTLTYRRLALRATGGSIANWTTTHQGSECLYLILATVKDGDKSALDYFAPDEIGDVDGDGMKEILDGWGNPLGFLRWAPGYSQHPGPDGQWGVASFDDDNNGVDDDIFEAGWPGSDDFSPLTLQTRIGLKHPSSGEIEFAPDPFDPLKIDPRLKDAINTNDTYDLRPLIFSAGPDKLFDINMRGVDSSGSPFRYSTTMPPNDPYHDDGSNPQAGAVGDTNLDGDESWLDNITNHFDEGQ